MSERTENFIPNSNVGKEDKVLCLDCAKKTRHRIEASFEVTGSEGDEDAGWSVDWANEYQVIRCLGCDSVSFRHLSSSSEDFPWDGPTVKLYPQRTSSSIPKKDIENLPHSLERIYEEVVDCYNGNCFTLCAAGLRAIVEGVCADQKIIDGPVEVPAAGGGNKTIRKENLEGMIAGLHEKGLLTEQNAATLHEHRFLGNHAVHELKKPSVVELRLAIEIVEHTLQQIYELPGKAHKLRRTMAARGKHTP